MKTFPHPVTLLIFLLFPWVCNAQSPCTGTPSANSVLPSSNFTICAGTSASLTLANTYSNSGIVFQWQSSTTSSVGPFSNIFNANEYQYITSVIHTTYYYNVVITCTNSGISIQIPVTVSVVPCYTPCSGTPSNTILPASQTLCAGSNATLAMANGLTYFTGYQFQWQSSPGSSGTYTPLSGSTNTTLITPTLNTTTYYNAVITCTNGGGTFTAAPVAVNVTTCSTCTGAPPVNPIVGPDTVCAGSAVTLTLSSTYSVAGITYQWHTSSTSPVGPWSQVSGATAPSFTSAPLFTTMYFYVAVTCTNTSSQTSMVHSVVVVPCATPCSGTPQATFILPASDTLCSGSQATLSLANSYSASSGISMQWYSSTVASGPFVPISGASQHTYVTSALSTGMYYQAVITCTNSTQSYTTPVAHISVISCTYCNGTPSSNSIVPVSPTLCAGNSLTLSLANSYPLSGYTYQWQASATSSAGPWFPLTGATGTAYATPALNNTTYFSVVVTCTNSNQSVTFYNAVTVFTCSACTGTPGPNSIVPASPTICINTSTILTLASSYTSSGLTYQWQSATVATGPWTPVAGANGASYVTPTLTGIAYFGVVVTCTNSGASSTFSGAVNVMPCNVVGEFDSVNGRVHTIRIFPNPSLDLVVIHSLIKSPGVITVYDLTGRILVSLPILDGRSAFSIGDLPPGIFMIQVRHDNQITTTKIIRE